SRVLAEWVATGRATGGGKTADLAVSEMILGYLRFAEEHYRKDGVPTTEPANIKLAMRPLKQLYGHTLAKDFGPLALKAVRNAMIEAELCRNECNKRTRHVV